MSDEIRFDNQVILVTGAGRGLGAAYAKLLAQRGATVVVHDGGVQRDGSGGDAEPARRVADEIVARGGTAVPETQNLSTKAACEELIHNAQHRFGRIDALIHSAGIVRYSAFANTTDAEWEAMLNVNIQAPFWLCRAVWPLMVGRDYGRIVLTVSGYGLNSYDGSDVTAYGVGKAAQFGLMNGLAGEAAGHNIRVNAISPVAATRIFRAEVAADEMTPESIAPAVALLAALECPFNGMVVRAMNGRFGLTQLRNSTEITFPQTPTIETLRHSLMHEPDT